MNETDRYNSWNSNNMGAVGGGGGGEGSTEYHLSLFSTISTGMTEALRGQYKEPLCNVRRVGELSLLR